MLTLEQIFNNIKLIELPNKSLKDSLVSSIVTTNKIIRQIQNAAFFENRKLTESEEKEMTKWILWTTAAGIKFIEMQDVTKRDVDKLKKEMEEQFKFVITQACKNTVTMFEDKVGE